LIFNFIYSVSKVKLKIPPGQGLYLTFLWVSP
jgi:hypothetical protein